MSVEQQRPVNLSLLTLKFPPMAIVSILHRVSGVLIAFFVPILLYLLSLSLRSPGAFTQLASCLSSPLTKIFTWLFLTLLFYHFLAGIRHLIMDLGYWESLVAGRRSSIGVLAGTVLIIILIGIWLWSGM